MNPKTYNRFKTMGYERHCKICGLIIGMTDDVESKASGKGPKLYHSWCYEDSHYDVIYTVETLKYYDRDDLEDVAEEFDLEVSDEISDEELINMIMEAQTKWAENENG